MAAIGWAQEFQRVATCTTTEARNGGAPHFGWDRAERRVTCYYFYVWDDEFGPAFVKIGSYFPYPIKVWLNGHEWAKRQATHGRDRLDRRWRTGSPAATTRPGCRQICDRLGPAQIQALLRPLAGPAAAAADRQRIGRPGIGGSCRCGRSRCPARWCSTSPRNGRVFFEALVADNLDLGRPEQIELIFGRKILPSTPGVFATRVVTRGVDVTVNVGYKHSRTKEYFKEGRALRIETVVNDPTDLGVLRRLVHLPELQAQGP